MIDIVDRELLKLCQKYTVLGHRQKRLQCQRSSLVLQIKRSTIQKT